jgi:hypothetical protein
MNRHRPNFYRRVRLFCELRVRDISIATGVSENRVADIECGRREPNDVERRLIEGFLRDKLRCVVDAEGPVPQWLRSESEALAQ